MDKFEPLPPNNLDPPSHPQKIWWRTCGCGCGQRLHDAGAHRPARDDRARVAAEIVLEHRVGRGEEEREEGVERGRLDGG